MQNSNLGQDLSIVIPVYNGAHYIVQSLGSVLAQTVQPKEIVILDDGSTDNIAEVVAEFQKKFDHIRFLKNTENKGVNFTVNRGMREVSTKYIMSFAVDDWLLPTFVEESMGLLQQYPHAGMCSTNSLVCLADKNNKFKAASLTKPINKPGFINQAKAQQQLLRHGSWFMGNAAILNRQHALEFGGYRTELGSFSDNFLYRQLALKYGCCFSPKKLSVWCIRYQSYSQSTYRDSAKTATIMVNYINIMENEYPDLFPQQMIAKELKRWTFITARTLAQTNRRSHLSKFSNALLSSLLFVYFRPFDIIPTLVRKSTMIGH